MVSTKVHMQDIQTPQEVTAIYNADAGQTFYNRRKTGEVLHMDTFHSPGAVEPKSVAAALVAGLSRRAPELNCVFETFLPYIDIQTAAGGGRLDGGLCYGQEQGVRKAHLTHVHLTALNTPEIVSAIFIMVEAVERSILNAGLELRKVQKVNICRGDSPTDIGNYKATSDSLLRSLAPSPTNASLSRREALAKQAAQEVGSASDTLRILEALSKGLKAGEFARLKPETDKNLDEIRQGLTRSRLACYDGNRYNLTEEGNLALSYLRQHCYEIETYLKRLLWSLPTRSIPGARQKWDTTKADQSRGRYLALSKTSGDCGAGIALPETIISRGLRARSGSQHGIFIPADLRFSYVKTKRDTPVILLLDASASMSGKRMAAAKELARHLILTGKGKVSVIIFQDSEVKTVCGFTKSFRLLDAGLKDVHAMGLTPLAKGLERVLEMSYASIKKPLVLCVTDGIPTVPSRSLSPIDDALEAAKRLAKRGIRLGCIGLEPNRSFLKQMVAEAKGTLYVVDELEASTLAAIARKERV